MELLLFVAVVFFLRWGMIAVWRLCGSVLVRRAMGRRLRTKRHGGKIGAHTHAHTHTHTHLLAFAAEKTNAKKKNNERIPRQPVLTSPPPPPICPYLSRPPLWQTVSTCEEAEAHLYRPVCVRYLTRCSDGQRAATDFPDASVLHSEAFVHHRSSSSPLSEGWTG